MKIETGKIIRGAQWIGELRQRGIKMTPSVAMLLTNNLLNMQNITSAYEQQAKELLGMQKLTNQQIVYVNLEKDDHIEAAAESVNIKEETFMDKIINIVKSLFK